MKKNIIIVLFIVGCAFPVFGMENKQSNTHRPRPVVRFTRKQDSSCFQLLSYNLDRYNRVERNSGDETELVNNYFNIDKCSGKKLSCPFCLPIKQNFF